MQCEYPPEREKTGERQRARRVLLCCGALILLLCLAAALYVSDYYHAAPEALAALESDAAVTVSKTGTGWLFDGPSADRALIFYPGGKVEETAYAPFLRLLAERGIDVYLVRMPARLAFLGINRAEAVMAENSCAHWYIGGHSLGGAAAAIYASAHGESLDGLILCAAYPTKPLDPALTELLLYGSEDGVLDREKLEEGRAFSTDRCLELVLKGGNHAGFGCYGPQKGDGEASLSPEEQQRQAADWIAAVLDAAG